jgi:hypothetical protein
MFSEKNINYYLHLDVKIHYFCEIEFSLQNFTELVPYRLEPHKIANVNSRDISRNILTKLILKSSFPTKIKIQVHLEAV